MQKGNSESDYDPAEYTYLERLYAHDIRKCPLLHRTVGKLTAERQKSVYRLVHNEEGYRRGKCRGTLLRLCHSESHSEREKQRKIIEYYRSDVRHHGQYRVGHCALSEYADKTVSL